METFISVLSALGDFANIVLAVIAVFALTRIMDLESYFSDRRKYRSMDGRVRDMLKAINTTRMGIIRPEGGINQFIHLIPHTNGPNVRESHLAVSRSWYMPALEYLVGEGFLIQEDSEECSIYKLTSSGERFIEKFAKRLYSHRFTGRFKDGVHQAKLARLNTQVLTGTVHTAIGAEPLGVETQPYANIFCIPPAEQKDGVVAKAYIIAEGLPVAKGDTVFVKFEDAPYHIHTYLTPRWAGNRFLGEGEKQVPTAAFGVKDIQPSGNGFQILSLSQER